jgi:hypothetical protein
MIVSEAWLGGSRAGPPRSCRGRGIGDPLLRFIAADFAPMNRIFQQTGLSERAIYDRTKAVMEYFGFPFNAPPPG